MAEPKRRQRKKKSGTPKWVTAPFEQFNRDTEALATMIQISAHGIALTQRSPQALELLMKIDKFEERSSKTTKADLDRAKERAQFAERESKSGFPVLNAWAVVALWAHLESLFRVFVATWLKHKRSAWKVEPIARLKIKLGEYRAIPRGEQYEFVAEQLERELGAGLKVGVSRFEKLLDVFELSGAVPELLRRTIYEFSQVRNVIVHRSGRVDQQFVRACPWLNVRVRADFKVSPDALRRYEFAAQTYIGIVICRLGEKYGVDMSEGRASLEKEVETRLSNQAVGAD